MGKAIGIDIGTSKICVMVFDLETFDVIAVKSVENSAAKDNVFPTHHVQDPEKIWKIVESVILELKGYYTGVEFIAITGQMHGLMLLDSENEPLTDFITWRDTRYPLFDECEKYAFLNGCKIHVGYGANTLLGLLGENNCFGKSSKICSITSYIMGKLCGDYRIDESMAASMGIYDIVNHCWNVGQLKTLDLYSSFDWRQPLSSGIPVAAILPSLKEKFCLSDDVTVFSPIGDNQASIIGAIGFNKLAVINIGTSGQLSMPVSEFSYKYPIETRPFPNFGYLQVYSSLCGGWAYQYLKEFCKGLLSLFGYDLTDRQIYEKLDSLIDNDCEEELGVDTLFLGTRENPEKRGMIYNIDTKNFTISNLANGFIKGILRELHHPDISLSSAKFIVGSGNAVRKSPFMKESIEREFNLDLKYPPFLEEATIGAIFLCYSFIYGEKSINEFFKKFYSD